MITHDLKVRLSFLEDVLGMSPNDEEIYTTYIGSKSPNAFTLEEEIEALGVNTVIENGTTVFPRTNDGIPFMYDYQIKGFFKDSCGMLSRLAEKTETGKKKPTNESSKLVAYKKIIDGLIFVFPRKIQLLTEDGLPYKPRAIINGEIVEGKLNTCQRPLRAQTAQGERIALANSEIIPAGATLEMTVSCLNKEHIVVVKEWLDYGILRGLGQWRNSGKGRFIWEEINE